MGEVDQRAVRSGVPAAQADATQSNCDVDVLLAPALETHVVPVDPLEVVPIDAEEVAVRAVVGNELGDTLDTHPATIAPCQGPERAHVTSRTEPVDHPPAMDRELLCENAARQRLGEVHAAASDEPPRRHARPDRAHEVAARNRLPVHEREVVGVGPQRAEVQDPGEAKAFVGVPHMDESLSQTRPPRVYDRLRVGAGAVVGHDRMRRALVLAAAAAVVRIAAAAAGLGQRPAHCVAGLDRQVVRRKVAGVDGNVVNSGPCRMGSGDQRGRDRQGGRQRCHGG